jgi:hypothetical protein
VFVDGGQEARQRSGGGGGRSKKEQAKCVCANARASVLGAPGCARSLEEDGVTREQELARRRRAWRHGEARVAAGLAWRARRMAAGGKTTVAASRRATHGICQEHEVALDQVAAAASGGARRLEQTPGGVARQKEASAGSGKAAARQGKARGWVQSGAGAAGGLHVAGRAAVRGHGAEEGEREVDEGGPG